jgi:hypothetical protein
MDSITLKIHRPWLGLNPRTLGPVASMLTTRPPRATTILVVLVQRLAIIPGVYVVYLSPSKQMLG